MIHVLHKKLFYIQHTRDTLCGLWSLVYRRDRLGFGHVVHLASVDSFKVSHMFPNGLPRCPWRKENIQEPEKVVSSQRRDRPLQMIPGLPKDLLFQRRLLLRSDSQMCPLKRRYGTTVLIFSSTGATQTTRTCILSLLPTVSLSFKPFFLGQHCPVSPCSQTWTRDFHEERKPHVVRYCLPL